MVQIIDTTPGREVDSLPFPMRKALRLNAKNILEGRMVVIDPGSTGMGYAVYVGGKMNNIGKLAPDEGTRVLHHRLQQLSEGVRRITEGADIVVFENIGAPNERTVIKSYLQLIKSIGAIHASTECKYTIEIKPRTWQLFCDDAYRKDDDMDALYMGHAVVELTKQVLESDSNYLEMAANG